MRPRNWRWLVVSLVVVAVVATVEGAIMLAMPWLMTWSPLPEWILDSGLLSLIAGPLIGWIVRDQVRKHEALRWQELHTQHAALLQLSTDGVIITDQSGIIESFNSGAELMFGWMAAEAVGQPIEVLIPRPARHLHSGQVRDYAAHGDKHHRIAGRGHISGQKRDGTVFPVEVTISRNPMGERTSLLAIVRDVTQRVQHEQELERARADAEQAARGKSEFLANMSHEIRTPMNAVVGLTGLLLDSPLTPQQREYLEVVRTSSDNLLVILNDILDFSKIEAGKLELEESPFALHECIESAAGLLAQRASEKGLELACEVDSALPSSAVGDAARLRQVIVNLLGNAVKFTAKGEVVVTARGARMEDGLWRVDVEVRDTGIGIAPDRLDRLFQSFSQADTSTTRVYGGTGLGLVIARRLCRAMGGDVAVRSELGQGTVFTATVLLREATVEVEPYSLEGEVLHGRVLVVDDNATNRTIFTRQLTHWGLQVTAVASGVEALAALEAHTFVAVLTDMQMPGMTGRELAERIRERDDAPPVICATSIGDRLSVAGPFVAVLTKPVREQALHRALVRASRSEPVTVPRPARGPLAPSAASHFAAQHPLRILVAEDNPVNQMVIRAQLEQMGYRPDIVANGREAVDATRSVPYDVILMDMQMPVMDGLEATRALRGADRPRHALRIIAMTASVLEHDREACFAAGMDEVLSKPAKVEGLMAALSASAAA